MRISDWSSDRVLFRSSGAFSYPVHPAGAAEAASPCPNTGDRACTTSTLHSKPHSPPPQHLRQRRHPPGKPQQRPAQQGPVHAVAGEQPVDAVVGVRGKRVLAAAHARSEEDTSELQSLMRISYAVFCLKKKNKHTNHL